MSAYKRLPNNAALFRVSLMSGLLTGIAAGTNVAGHVFAARWTSATAVAFIQRLKLRWQTTTAFTAAQELSFQIYRLTGYSASHTAGNGTALTAPALKRDTLNPVSVLGDLRIAAAAALTAGTHTLDNVGMGGVNGWSQAGAVVDDMAMEATIEAPRDQSHTLVLRTNEGIIVRNEVLMGAAGVGRLLVEMDWFELS